MRELADGKWKLTVDAGRDGRRRRRRITKTVRGSRREAAQALAALTAEVQSGKRRPIANPETGATPSLDELMAWYLDSSLGKSVVSNEQPCSATARCTGCGFGIRSVT